MLSQILTISKFTILEALRNRLVLLLLVIMGAAFGVIQFVGDLTITDHLATQTSILASFLRLFAVVFISLFVVTSMARELNDKTLDMILATSVKRSSYYFGKLIGFVGMAMIVSILFMLFLLIYASADNVLIWGLSLVMETSIVVAFALVMLFSFNQIPAAMTGVFILYIASRVMAPLVLMSENPVLPHSSLGQQFMDGFISGLSWVLPGLDRFTQTDWITYGAAGLEVLPPLLIQTLIYMFFLSSVALFDLYRKNF